MISLVTFVTASQLIEKITIALTTNEKHDSIVTNQTHDTDGIFNVAIG